MKLLILFKVVDGGWTFGLHHQRSAGTQYFGLLWDSRKENSDHGYQLIRLQVHDYRNIFVDNYYMFFEIYSKLSVHSIIGIFNVRK